MLGRGPTLLLGLIGFNPMIAHWGHLQVPMDYHTGEQIARYFLLYFIRRGVMQD